MELDKKKEIKTLTEYELKRIEGGSILGFLVAAFVVTVVFSFLATCFK